MHTPTDASLSARFSALCGFFACLFFVVSVSSGAAATLYVSQDGNDNNSGTATSPYRTIQAAVNNASSEDTITLHASTFSGNGNRDIDFAGKSLTINSDSGATRTVIDCEGTNQERHRAFYFHSKEVNVLLDGLTIKNASDNGAVNVGQDCKVKISKCTFTSNTQTGVYNSGTATLTDCFFTGNTSDSGGFSTGGVYNAGMATLANCSFTSNTAPDGVSGGIANNGTATLSSCLFTGNTAGGGSGGIYNTETVTLSGCSFAGNIGSAGGGISNGGTATLSGCLFIGNTTGNNGGGIFNGGTSTLTGCSFTGNTAGAGGGVFNQGYNFVVTNCIVSGNTTTAGNGGGMFNSGNAVIRSCSISGNIVKVTANQQAPAQGGALENDGTVILTDDVLWGNTAPNAAEVGTPANGNQKTTATYCDIQGGLSGTGNIKTNPGFMDAANGNLHLQAGSPCRGAGIAIGPTKADPNQYNSQPDPGVSTDADGRHRPNPPSIGAYEYTANPPPAKKRPLIDIGSAETGNASDNAPPADSAGPVLGAAAVPTTGAAAVPPAAPQARPTLGPAEQKQANDEFLHLLVSIDTNTLSHDEMTRQIQGELAKGAQIDARDGEGFPAIVTAASLKRTDVVQVLLELGADPNALTVQVSSADANASDDSSILHKTANGYQVNVGAVVSSIFGHKSKPKPAYGQAALMFAAQNGTADMVTLLLNAKVVVNMRDSRGKSALDYASDAHHDDIVATLKAHGAG